MEYPKRHSLVQSEHIVAGAIDDNMVYPLLVWAWSLAHTAQQSFRIVIGFLDGELKASHREFLGKVLTELSISHNFFELGQDERFIRQGHISPTTFAKFLLADALGEAHVWIDVDTAASPGWDDIFAEISSAPKSISLVVADRGAPGQERKASTEAKHSLRFNAGVLGWPKRKRKEWSQMLTTIGIVDTQEQALFNTLYGDELKIIDESYNTLTYRYDSFAGMTLPRITHYAGAHKPWHLPRRFRKLCVAHKCPWSVWFVAERGLIAHLRGSSLTSEVLRLKKKALRSGRVSFSRDHSGLLFLRALGSMGLAGWAIIGIAKPMRSLIPRGTHPLH